MMKTKEATDIRYMNILKNADIQPRPTENAPAEVIWDAATGKLKVVYGPLDAGQPPLLK
jgi:hypothetical protein